MGAKGLFGLGALAFWLPEIALYAWQRQAPRVEEAKFPNFAQETLDATGPISVIDSRLC